MRAARAIVRCMLAKEPHRRQSSVTPDHTPVRPGAFPLRTAHIPREATSHPAEHRPAPAFGKSAGGALEMEAMRTQVLRIVIPAAMWASLTGAIATEASANAAGLGKSPPPSVTWTQLLRSASASNTTSARDTGYWPDALDTGPPTPGPTDPNAPSS